MARLQNHNDDHLIPTPILVEELVTQSHFHIDIQVVLYSSNLPQCRNNVQFVVNCTTGGVNIRLGCVMDVPKTMLLTAETVHKQSSMQTIILEQNDK